MARRIPRHFFARCRRFPDAPVVRLVPTCRRSVRRAAGQAGRPVRSPAHSSFRRRPDRRIDRGPVVKFFSLWLKTPQRGQDRRTGVTQHGHELCRSKAVTGLQTALNGLERCFEAVPRLLTAAADPDLPPERLPGTVPMPLEAVSSVLDRCASRIPLRARPRPLNAVTGLSARLAWMPWGAVGGPAPAPAAADLRQPVRGISIGIGIGARAGACAAMAIRPVKAIPSIKTQRSTVLWKTSRFSTADATAPRRNGAGCRTHTLPRRFSRTA